MQAQAGNHAADAESCCEESGAAFGGVIGTRLADSVEAWPEPASPPERAPNVLIWLIDDAGFAHLGAFGGVIDTPNLDRLAATGLAYTNFHATPLCSPSRAALLTGRNSHAVHMGSHASTAMGFPGYDAHIPASAATTAKVLREQGYATIALGKWDHTPAQYISPAGPFELWPLGQGFEHFYGFQSFESDHYQPTLWQGNSLLSPAGRDKNYFLTTDLADRAIELIDNMAATDSDKPFYLYWATGAVHSPHQAPEEWRQRYRGRFDGGWDSTREKIFRRQMELGILPSGTRLSPRPADIPAWSGLSPDEKRLYARQMEVFAAQLSQADHEFGRILAALERSGELDNTLVIVTSDNGASAEGGLGGLYSMMRGANGQPPTLAENLQRLENWGGPGTMPHYHAGWAMAGNTPFRYFKQSAFSGGRHVPLILHWPAGIRAHGELRNQYHHLIDISPSILMAAGVVPPQSVDGVRQQPIDGIAMNYSFEDPNAPDRRLLQYYELWGNRGIYENGWLAVVQHNSAPWEITLRHSFDDDRWELFNLDEDFSETENLAAGQPERLAALQTRFDELARQYGIYPLDDYIPRGLAIQRRLQGDRTRFEYAGAPLAVAELLMPPIKQQSHWITANVTVADLPNGVIAAAGGEEAGFSFYLKDGLLQYVYNDLGRGESRLSSQRPLRAGHFTVSFRYQALPGTPAHGSGELYIDGERVAMGEMARSVPFTYSGAGELFNIGQDTGTAVTPDYDPPFSFQGTIEDVVIELK
jgi:arylsulfatase